MRLGLIGSILIHIVVFGLVIFNFTRGRKSDVPPPLPVSVEIMSPKEYSERQAGKTDGSAEKAVPPAEVKAAEAQATTKKEVEQKPAPKPAEKEALPPPPKAAEAPQPTVKPAEQPKIEKAEVAPEKPAEKPAPKHVAKKEPASKPVRKAKLEEPKKAEEPEQKRPDSRPVPERTFDPKKIASLIEKDAPEEARPPASQPAMEAKPSRVYSDRQSAVLNRDPNAGTPGGDYDPSRPWRPASSLQQQAMGLPQAQGQMNAGSCADLVQSRIEQNWDLPIGALSAENTVVRLRIELNRDGTLQHPPTIMDASMSPSYQAMADAAVRAAIRGQPYRIPPDQFERCRDMVLRFNPRDMYGG